MKIHGFHDGAACGQIRVLLPLDALRDLGGHTVTTSHGIPRDAAGIRAIVDSDLVVAQRLDKVEALPIWRRLSVGRRLVYEIDDDLWHIDPHNLRARRLANAQARDVIETAIGIADLVTVTTEPLAELVRHHNPNVRVIPNHIDGRVLGLAKLDNQKPVLGWAGGDSHFPDLIPLAKTLKRFLHQFLAWEFHTIGLEFGELAGIPARHTPWSTNLFTYYTNIDFDIGICPVKDTTFNRSKSGIKAIEYMARGIPVIASDLELYRGVVEHGVTGFLVRRPHEWMHYLRELASDPDLRGRMGRAGREAVRRHWQIQDGWRLWDQAYEAIVKNKRAAPVGG